MTRVQNNKNRFLKKLGSAFILYAAKANRSLRYKISLLTVTILSVFASSTAVAFNIYPFGPPEPPEEAEKWGTSITVGTTGETVYWSFLPAGTSGDPYCANPTENACRGSSTLTLPNFWDPTANGGIGGFVPMTLTDLESHMTRAFNQWSSLARINFVKLPTADSGVAINDTTAVPPNTGHIRIGAFSFQDAGGTLLDFPAAVGYAAPPNGFYPNTNVFMTGAGDILFNTNVGYQIAEGNEGDTIVSFPPGGGLLRNDFEGLFLHELGHALGLNHSEVATAVMCGFHPEDNPFPPNCDFSKINRIPDADDVAGVQFLYGATPTHLLPNNQWHQIGLPFGPGASNTANDIFGDDELGTYDTDWVIYRYDTSTDSYVKPALTDTLSQGVGYWIIQATDSDKTLDMPYAITPTTNPTDCPPGDQCFAIPLGTEAGTTQWNMLGYPFSNQTALDNASVVANTNQCLTGCTLNEAEMDSVLHNQLFNYDGTDYITIDTSTGILSPWTGYWGNTLNNADGNAPSLLISKPGT